MSFAHDAAMRAAEDLDGRLDTAEKELSEARATIERLRTDMTALRASEVAAVARASKLALDLQTMQGEAAEARRDVRHRDETIASLRLTVRETSSACQTLVERCERAESARDESAGSAEALRKRAEQLTLERGFTDAEQKRDMADLRARLERERHEAAKNHDETVRLNAEVARLKRTLETATPWEVSSPPTDEELRALFRRWSTGPEQYQADCDLLIAAITDLRDQLREIRRTVIASVRGEEYAATLNGPALDEYAGSTGEDVANLAARMRAMQAERDESRTAQKESLVKMLRHRDTLAALLRTVRRERAERAAWLASLPDGSCGNPPPAALVAAEAATGEMLRAMEEGR